MEMYVEPKLKPRNVEMDRRRRIYRYLKVQEALENEGIYPCDMLPPEVTLPLTTYEEKYGLYGQANYLPLEIFDDEEYDCRTVNDWVTLGVIDGVRHPLPAMVFVEKLMSYEMRIRLSVGDDSIFDHLYEWCHAAVTDYEKETKLWTVVTLDGRKRSFKLPRIYIRFFAEDPRLYAKRVVAATQAKRETEISIRYNFYLDCMILDGMPTITEEQKAIIIHSALRFGTLKYRTEKIERVVEDLALDYQRTMCLLMWWKLMQERPDMFKFLPWTLPSYERVVPETGKVATGMHNFQASRDYFRWITLYVSPEVYHALACVEKECMDVANMNLFASNYGRCATLSEFDSQQLQTSQSLAKYLKDPWLVKIAQLVRMCLRDVGKGWFNLEQKLHDIYEVMKLKRFMQLLVFRMQYALRVLVESSVASFLQLLETPALCTLGVANDFVWGDNLMVSEFVSHALPIFDINLLMDDVGPFYSTVPKQYGETILSLFDNAVVLCHQIRQVHPLLLPFLRFPSDLHLSSVGLLDEKICDARERLRRAYQKAIIPLIAYAKEYQKYHYLYTLNVVSYVNTFASEEHTAFEIKEEISMHVRMRQNLEITIPKKICIGPFNVNLGFLRDALLAKRLECSTGLLAMFTDKLRLETEDLLTEYTIIKRKLCEAPQDIEHLFDIRDWMETIPVTVKGLDEIMQRLKIEYDILEFFMWNLSDEDFQAEWRGIGFPREIQLQVEETTERLADELDKFAKVHLQDEINLCERIDTLVGNVTNVALQMDIGKVHETAIDVRRIWKAMKECQELGLVLNSRQKLFGYPVVPFENINKLTRDFEPYHTLWTTASDWLRWHDVWMDNPLMNVDSQQIDGMINEMYKGMTRCARIFEEFPKVAGIALATRAQIDDFKPYVDMIQALRNPGMKPRHFEEISGRIGLQLALTPTVTFKNFLILGIMDFEEEIKLVADGAAKEYSIEGALNSMITEWEDITMEVLPYKNTGTYIMKVADETHMLLDDQILAAQQITLSPFKAAFEVVIENFEHKLKLMQEVIALWIEVQKQWMYLEPIFTSEDINRQLPIETRKYKTMDRNWRRIMKAAFECPYIIRTCPDKTILETLKECLNLLEFVQKGLSEYLETKRMVFPRFFFLSDDELLDIVAQTKNIFAVQPHLKKCFENMKELRFEEDLEITRMYSADGEEVGLRPTLYPRGNVEDWLLLVESSMRNTLREIIGDALAVVETKSRKEWVYMWPGQVVLCGGQTYWTTHVEEGILGNSLKDYYTLLLSHLDDLRELVRGQQTDIQRLMLEAVIVIEVHARDVLYKLVEENVVNINDFEWISQLRYYWVDEQLTIRAVNAEFPYGYEYLGNNGRLVITPLTDRCYLTLIGALHLKFGGAPAGPAGTGKTETTKDLGKAFAIQCVVFNCSDQLDYMSMGKFFKGLASAGAWACFDEFNRIDIEVLSVISQQIMTIQKAQQVNAPVFLFEGVDLNLKASCAVFITMNPGYAGRTELPDNLKALFRPVAMMVPNYTLIAEISLFSYGFNEAKTLAGKITTTFKLSSEQLSTQDHYDFGMRAVKTVIAVAGNLKREQRDLEEPQICLRALRDVNVPKFLKDDLKLFNGIVSDLFPRMVEKPVDYGILEKEIRNTSKKMMLQDVDEFVKKVIQLYETTIVRHGLMLVGPTGSGKTKCYEVLKNACTALKGKPQPSGKPFVPVLTFVLNPKSITMGQLYGEFDLDTHEWTDGIFSTLLRAGTIANDDSKRWYVFDGPVDAVWIENMNTVLDDNKKLCLTSGEIMKLVPTQTMMFEVADLRVASPATVSRCGMVYMEPEGLGLQPLIDCWIRSMPPVLDEYAVDLANYSRELVYPALDMLRGQLREIVSTMDSGMVQSYINLMNFRFSPMFGREGKPPPPLVFQTTIWDLLSPWAAFSVVWSIGATCDYKGRCIFSDWLKKVQQKNGHLMPFPADGLVYDYRLHDGGFTDPIDVNMPIPPQWYKWLDDIPPLKITLDMKFADMEVPTMDNVRTAALIGYLLQNETNTLCVGPTGSGKTLTISSKLSGNMPKKFICDFITFSARTSANQTQDVLDNKLDKRRKGLYGPPVMKKQIFFIDDLNMPALDTYGAQPPIELIRQFMDFRGWYDRNDIGTFRMIEDVNFVCAMGPPGGGRNPVTARLLRHFHILVLPEMEDDAKTIIFSTILSPWMSCVNGMENMVDAIVTATLSVYTSICLELLPTPDRSHYTFNLRDLSKVFQGVLMANPDTIENTDVFFQLWYHENIRVFGDRLVNDRDRDWLDQLLKTMLMKTFNWDVEQVIKNETLFYGDFCGPAGYVKITDLKVLETTLLRHLEEYNTSTTAPMKLVLFQDAMGHICRIVRILRQPRGNGLLLGLGGSGRQSLMKLSSHVQDYGCRQIELTKAYTMNDWRDDIKNIMLECGLHNHPKVFLFSDTQIKTDSMLEDLNNILNSGDVPNIYATEEMDQIYNIMKGAVQEAGLPLTRSNLFSMYLKNVRNNLHVVITMSPLGEIFRARIRQFPALVNCCTINWFCPWPEAALMDVAMQFLTDIQDESINDNVLSGIVTTCQFMHSSVTEASERFRQELNRHNYVTPTSYLELLSSYGDLLQGKKGELHASINRLSQGLSKLVTTEIEVKDMQVLLIQMKPELEKAAIATAAMIERITLDTAKAEKASAEAKAQEAAAATLKKESQAIKNDAEADLSVAKPMLDAAEASLKALNKSDITEVKAMKRPPVGVVLVIEALCIVNDIKPNKLPGMNVGEKILDYWTPGSQMLADPGHFLHMMENYNKNDITEQMIERLKVYIESPDFAPAKIIQVSKACYSICLWLHAMYNYYFVNKKVAPKMAALAQAETVLIETEVLLAAAKEKLTEVQKGIDRLQYLLQTEELQKAELEKQKQLCEDRMGRAVKLITGLADEQGRWIVTTSEMDVALRNAIGDILLSAGAIAYLTPFTDIYRQSLLASWYEVLGEVPHTPKCSPVSTLGDPVTIRKWQIEGLPRDALSVENAVLVMNSKRWPLFIDPQGQANKWIRTMAKASGLTTAKQTDKDLIRILENCIRFGKTCLIENVGSELISALDPLLVRALFKHGGQLSIKLGESIIPYNNDFRLYITTRLCNPHYSPEVSAKVLVVNFALTVSGLLDQMLSLVTTQERPDLEQARNALILANAEMRRELKEIEDRILYRLSVSEGSAVDDIDLIVILDASKDKSEEIKTKMQAAENTQVDIDATRSLYIPVANRAQILFFCLSDLQQIDTMYQYSLEWFVETFITSIANTEKSVDIEMRVLNINKSFTFTLFSNVCRSLFERHKLHFAFLLCARIRMDAKLVDPREWKHFLAGGLPETEMPNPASSWLSARSWRDIQALAVLPHYTKFVSKFGDSVNDFKQIFDAPDAHLIPLPAPWTQHFNDFQRLLILKCLRPDKVTNAMQIYLAENLGRQFVEPQTTELSAVFKESSPTKPLVFIISTGTDPAAELYKFADKLKMAKRLFSISLGQGQGPRAELMLKQSAEVGNWVFFQNCHLAPSFMPRLEALVENMTADTHREFRLWLTSTASPHFPAFILQNSSKMTVEPPQGVKANMLRAYLTQVVELRDFMHSEDPKVPAFKWLLFSLCVFHAILLERRKFGPLGFNIPYEFTEGDLTMCISQLRMFVLEYKELPFKVLIYTAGHINYGGRITDDWDRRTLLTLLADYYSPQVISDDYQFDKQGEYHQLPVDATYSDYVQYVKGLPINDHPLMFGLHSNADMTFAQAETYACLESLLSVQPNEDASAEEDPAHATIRLANDMLASVPKKFNLFKLQELYPVSYGESLNTVLVQEAKRYNALLEEVNNTLANLLKALKGLVVLSEQLERMATSLSKNKIPDMWQSKGYPSLKPLGAWFQDLQERVKFITGWRNNGIPAAFWISGFYFPQAFLTGTLQNFARKHVVSIDSIEFSFEVLPAIPTIKPQNGCVVYGLFLEGCRWNGQILTESHPKELYTNMAPIYLLPEVNHVIPESGIYTCPVYKTITRAGTLSTTGHSTNFVLPMEIPSEQPQAHWIKRGVALICAMDY